MEERLECRQDLDCMMFMETQEPLWDMWNFGGEEKGISTANVSLGHSNLFTRPQEEPGRIGITSVELRLLCLPNREHRLFLGDTEGDNNWPVWWPTSIPFIRHCLLGIDSLALASTGSSAPVLSIGFRLCPVRDPHSPGSE